MQSQNFEFLRPSWEELTELGALAELHAHVDPPSTTVKLRAFAEQVVLFIYHQHGIPTERQFNLNDLLTGANFQQCVPRVILSKLHTLRVNGNNAAHGEPVLASTALWLLQEAYELGRWIHLTYAGGSTADCLEFVPPSAAGGTEVEKKLKRERTAILAHLAAQEEQWRLGAGC
jgi:type I restriction enzyme R subunit